MAKKDRAAAGLHPLLYVTVGILVGLLVSGLVLVLASAPAGKPVTLLPTATRVPVTVYVTGAVASPGVYILPAGSRVEAAVRAAGGFLEEAETEQVNLALPLEDGQQVDVPGILRSDHVRSSRVNINTATVSELDSLPGIGPTTAQAIVDYRLLYGLFSSLQEIQNVAGVGPATFERIKDYITLDS